ncbi:MAG: formate dehydrogenase accessory sulfurtransferase FdhD [Acidobacteriota bacterium]
MEDPGIRKFQVSKDGREQEDCLAVEEPLEIRLVYRENGRLTEKSVSITMRTPGHDYELAVGFLHGEGILQGRHSLQSVKPILPERPGCNVVRVPLAKGTEFDPSSLERHFYATSSCGVCGKASLEALQTMQGPEMMPGRPRISRQVIPSLPQRLGEAQSVFQHTGGLHAAALFDTQGNLVCLREDVGRHNAVDKVVGLQLLEGNLPLDESILMVSGRTSFEILQKAWAAGISVVAAVSAPSSLAVELAQEFGMTLLGFVRGDSFNVYSDRERLF